MSQPRAKTRNSHHYAPALLFVLDRITTLKHPQTTGPRVDILYRPRLPLD